MPQTTARSGERGLLLRNLLISNGLALSSQLRPWLASVDALLGGIVRLLGGGSNRPKAAPKGGECVGIAGGLRVECVLNAC